MPSSREPLEDSKASSNSTIRSTKPNYPRVSFVRLVKAVIVGTLLCSAGAIKVGKPPRPRLQPMAGGTSTAAKATDPRATLIGNGMLSSVQVRLGDLRAAGADRVLIAEMHDLTGNAKAVQDVVGAFWEPITLYREAHMRDSPEKCRDIERYCKEPGHSNDCAPAFANFLSQRSLGEPVEDLSTMLMEDVTIKWAPFKDTKVDHFQRFLKDPAPLVIFSGGENHVSAEVREDTQELYDGCLNLKSSIRDDKSYGHLPLSRYKRIWDGFGQALSHGRKPIVVVPNQLFEEVDKELHRSVGSSKKSCMAHYKKIGMEVEQHDGYMLAYPPSLAGAQHKSEL